MRKGFKKLLDLRNQTIMALGVCLIVTYFAGSTRGVYLAIALLFYLVILQYKIKR